jgi:hypothetical protein
VSNLDHVSRQAFTDFSVWYLLIFLRKYLLIFLSRYLLMFLSKYLLMFLSLPSVLSSVCPAYFHQPVQRTFISRYLLMFLSKPGTLPFSLDHASVTPPSA